MKVRSTRNAFFFFFFAGLAGSWAWAAPCTDQVLTCPVAVGSGPSEGQATDVATSNSLNQCSVRAVSEYGDLCQGSGARCGTYTVFSGHVERNPPEFLATGSAVVKCY